MSLENENVNVNECESKKELELYFETWQRGDERSGDHAEERQYIYKCGWPHFITFSPYSFAAKQFHIADFCLFVFLGIRVFLWQHSMRTCRYPCLLLEQLDGLSAGDGTVGMNSPKMIQSHLDDSTKPLSGLCNSHEVNSDRWLEGNVALAHYFTFNIKDTNTHTNVYVYTYLYHVSGNEKVSMTNEKNN